MNNSDYSWCVTGKKVTSVTEKKEENFVLLHPFFCLRCTPKRDMRRRKNKEDRCLKCSIVETALSQQASPFGTHGSLLGETLP